MKYWDISPLIHPGTAVFPGDKSFSRSVAVDFTEGNNFLLSSMDSTLHIGAHADATNHYHKSGEGIEKRDLTSDPSIASKRKTNSAKRHRQLQH
jgi:arylformamidase